MTVVVIAYFYLFVLLVVSVVGAFRYKRVQYGYVRATIHLVWFATLLELTSKFIVAPLMLNTLWLFNLIIPVLLLLINTVYYQYFHGYQLIRRMIMISYLLFLPFYMINLLCIQSFMKELHSHAIQLMALCILVWIFFYFRLKLQRPESGNLEKDPIFWISTGLLLFYGAQVFTVGSINYYNSIGKLELGILVASIIQMINIPMNIMFLIAILVCPMSPKKSS